MDKDTRALYEGAENFGLLTVMAMFESEITVRIPLSNSFCDQPIETLDLSVRSNNGLRRSGAENINDIYNIIMSESGLKSIRNLGKKSINEIKTSMLVYGYNGLNENEKLEFWKHFISDNCN